MQNNLRNNFAKYKTMNKKERLEAIIKHYSDGKPSVFAKLIGVAPSTISSWLSRDTLDYDLLFAKCENLSSEWLLTGRGEMINIQTATFNNTTTLPQKERLEAIIKHYSDGKPSVFAKLIGVAPSTISSWLSRDTLDYDLLFAKCENLSSEWLLTGRGEMINIQTATFNNTTTLPQKESTGIEDKLLAIIADKDATIREMAEEIGALKQTIVQLKQDNLGRVSGAESSTLAGAG